MERQRGLIDSARIFFSGRTLNREIIRQSPTYATIRSHLSPSVTANIERRNTTGGEQAIQENIMRELAELEQKWKLI